VTETTGPGYRVERVEHEGGLVTLHFSGELRFRQCFPSWERVGQLARPPGVRTELDLAAVEHLDGAAAALLLDLRHELAAKGGEVEIVGPTGAVQALLDLYGAHQRKPSQKLAPTRIGVLDQIGRETLAIFGESRALDFIGDMVLAAAQAVRHPRIVNWADVLRLLERAGADGLPIVLILNFLVGLVTGFQAAIQLAQFGANLFVADLVGLSMTRELAPLMTAIIVAGRSGAAFSAELGTMRVNEEVDALRTLGLDPYHFLVFPRVIALLLVLPLLTVLADVAGIAGGLLVALLRLDLTFTAFLVETQSAVHAWDVFSGILKTVFFGTSIALIACERGLATSGGAEGVGRATTSAVVTSLFAIVVLDAIFTVLFNAFGG
jgi:phospholipid/cholesterol/gamma-HCH transport system permease protein